MQLELISFIASRQVKFVKVNDDSYSFIIGLKIRNMKGIIQTVCCNGSNGLK